MERSARLSAGNTPGTLARVGRLTVIGLCAYLTGCTGAGHPRDLSVLRAAPLYTFNEREVDDYLRWFAAQSMPVPQRALVLARKNIGQPYRMFLLGEFPFELHDPDPLYCLSASDCLTFIESTYAMALSKDWGTFFKMLQRIRYKNGEIGLATRNHFVEADWNLNNAWLFHDVTNSLGVVPTHYHETIDRAAFLARRGVRSGTPRQVLEDSFLPTDVLPHIADHLNDGDVIELLAGKIESPYVGHIGLIAHDSAGQVTLIHSGAPAVRELPLAEYLRRHPRFVGFKFLRYGEAAQPAP